MIGLLKKAFFRIRQKYYRRQSQYLHTGRVAVCCIAKCENNYIREYVEHYLSIGVDKIFIYDNNDVEGERFDEIIGDYIVQDKCEIVNYRGRKLCQLQAYQECYQQHRKEYEWIAFFDCDEFLEIVDKSFNIHSFLSQEKFKAFQLILVNWMVYGDNEMLDDDGRPLQERFKMPIEPFDFFGSAPQPENCHIKTIIRGNLTDIRWGQGCCHTHSPLNRFYRSCNPSGLQAIENCPFQTIDFSSAYLRHYSTKTIGEYVRNKWKRGFADRTKEECEKIFTLDYFFRYNRRTAQKEAYLEKLLNDVYGK